MGVTVYPRLASLLAARHLSVSALEREIERRFGLAVDVKTLYRLTQAAPVQRADLAIAGAAAAVLGVGLDDLFRVEATPVGPTTTAADAHDLAPAQAARLAELFDLQARRLLTEAERAEVDALVAEYGCRQHERHIGAYAERHRVTLDEARQAVVTELREADDWWRTLEADPERRRAFIRRVKRQRAGHAQPARPEPPTAAHG